MPGLGIESNGLRTKVLQMQAPLDLQCAACGKVGVNISVVFPVLYGVDLGRDQFDDVQFSSPDLDVPVQVLCQHCPNVVNYGPVGRITAGSLLGHESDTETAPAAAFTEASGPEG